MTDLYPDEEGMILDGLTIGFAYAAGSITLNQCVALDSTAVSGVVSVVAGSSDGDSVGVALKTAVTGDRLPVLLFGMMKLYAGDTITSGDIVQNDSSPAYVIPISA